ncbi:hypothetical protein AMTRI_Chr11g99670 [Amborella trichopoda]
MLLITKLSPAELSECRPKGLFYNCNEKFGPSHRCKKLFLIEGSWSGDEDEDPTEIETTHNDAEVPEISIHAIPGVRSSQTMRVQGKMGLHQVIFLIDIGNTHNFMNNKIARKTGMTTNNKGSDVLQAPANKIIDKMEFSKETKKRKRRTHVANILVHTRIAR